MAAARQICTRSTASGLQDFHRWVRASAALRTTHRQWMALTWSVGPRRKVWTSGASVAAAEAEAEAEGVASGVAEVVAGDVGKAAARSATGAVAAVTECVRVRVSTVPLALACVYMQHRRRCCNCICCQRRAKQHASPTLAGGWIGSLFSFHLSPLPALPTSINAPRSMHQRSKEPVLVASEPYTGCGAFIGNRSTDICKALMSSPCKAACLHLGQLHSRARAWQLIMRTFMANVKVSVCLAREEMCVLTQCSGESCYTP